MNAIKGHLIKWLTHRFAIVQLVLLLRAFPQGLSATPWTQKKPRSDNRNL